MWLQPLPKEDVVSLHMASIFWETSLLQSYYVDVKSLQFLVNDDSFLGIVDLLGVF